MTINFKFHPFDNLRTRISNFKLNCGVTLIELLIYMGLLSIFLTVLTSIFTTTLDVQLESRSTSHIDQDGRFILARLIYDLNRADSITTPGTLGATASTMQFVIGGTTYTYQLNTTNLTLTDGTGTEQLNDYDTDISNLSFTRFGNLNGANTIKVSFKITSKVQQPKGFESRDFSTTIGIR